MNRFPEGDRVRVVIPYLDDPDHEPFHGKHGVVVDILVDDTGSETGDERDDTSYRGELDDGDTMDFP